MRPTSGAALAGAVEAEATRGAFSANLLASDVHEVIAVDEMNAMKAASQSDGGAAMVGSLHLPEY